MAEANAEVQLQLPFADAEDFEDARRGRIGSLSDPVIRATDGRVVWDADAYEFLDGECPETVNPSLWRQGQLNPIHGLFEVTEGIYQVRGLDLSNMTFVEGDDRRARDRSADLDENARQRRWRCIAQHRGDRPVTAVIYTHSHVDHYGGVRGVVVGRGRRRRLPGSRRRRVSASTPSARTCTRATR